MVAAPISLLRRLVRINLSLGCVPRSGTKISETIGLQSKVTCISEALV